MTRLVIVGFVMAAVPLSASAVVVFRSPRSIILASDSLRQSDAGVRERLCKVRAAGRWWITSGGLSSAPGLDVMAETAAALATVPTLNAAKDALVSRLYPKINAVLNNARHSPGFGLLFAAGDEALAIIVAGTNINDPTLRVGLFRVVLDTVEPLHLSTAWYECPGATSGWCVDGGDGADRATVRFGTTVAAGPLVARLTPPLAAWVTRLDAAAARRIIKEQIAATPDDVGAPIDVLQIDAHGARWVDQDKGSLCARVP